MRPIFITFSILTSFSSLAVNLDDYLGNYTGKDNKGRECTISITSDSFGPKSFDFDITSNKMDNEFGPHFDESPLNDTMSIIATENHDNNIHKRFVIKLFVKVDHNLNPLSFKIIKKGTKRMGKTYSKAVAECTNLTRE